MQKFFRVFIVIIFFFACLFAGVYLAGFTNSDSQQSLSTNELDNTNQVNLLVFVVNQFDEKKPEFHSAWSVILYYPNPKGFVLVPLSSLSENNQNEISRNFKLDSKKFPTKNTIKFHEDKFNAQWDGEIVLDIQAIQFLLNWLTNDSISIDPMFQNEESNSIENINKTTISLCKYLSDNPLPDWNKLNVSTIFQSHFQSSLSNESMEKIWNIMRDEIPPKCEIIQLEKEQN